MSARKSCRPENGDTLAQPDRPVPENQPSGSASETVPAPLRRGARRTPEAPALLGPAGETVSYDALDMAVERADARLEAAGLGPGDRVACLLPRGAAYVALLLALWRRRAVAAPLPARDPPAGRRRLLRTLSADALVTGGDFHDKTAREEGLQTLRADELVGDPFSQHVSQHVRKPGGTAEDAAWPATRPLTLIFTSGSTGTPKAATHTAGNHFFSAEGARRNQPLGPGDRWLLSLPLYHVGGLAIVLRCLWVGATVAVPAEGERPARAIPRTAATHVSLVAAQLRRLLKATQDDRDALRSLKTMLLGGGPVPPVLIEKACAAGWPVATSYGLTETTSQVATTAPGDDRGVLVRTTGRPLPHRRVRIRRAAPGNQHGEILVKGRTRFAGYVEGGKLRRPFVHAFGEGGWLPTGDLGRLGEDGRLRVAGRRDRQFVSGGENVQPGEIEAVLRRRPAVAEAAVVPVPHATFGQRPVAFIRKSRGEPFSSTDEAALRGALRERLPAYKIPDAFYPWPQQADPGTRPDRAFLRQKAKQLREQARE
jgi:O-succinylbenzoic acid--CoA ligase